MMNNHWIIENVVLNVPVPFLLMKEGGSLGMKTPVSSGITYNTRLRGFNSYVRSIF